MAATSITSRSGSLAPRVRVERAWLLLVIAVVAISALHYLTSRQWVMLHEVFKRLYYIPIIVAAVLAGVKGGLAISLLSTALYMPHVVLEWCVWPALDAEQYGEALMFNAIALVTGILSQRLHAERECHRQAAIDLRVAYDRLREGSGERQRVDRLVTIGRIASGIAHEVRTPLAGLLGSLEILENEFSGGDPKAEFFAIARRQIERLQQVVTEFLEFAQPAPPTVRAVDLRQLIDTTTRLARITLARRGVSLDAPVFDRAVIVDVDAEQVQRALLGIMLSDTPALRNGHIDITIADRDAAAEVVLDVDGLTSEPDVSGLFEAFPATAGQHGLALATAARLIGNQHGSVAAEIVDDRLRYRIKLPRAREAMDVRRPA